MSLGEPENVVLRVQSRTIQWWRRDSLHSPRIITNQWLHTAISHTDQGCFTYIISSGTVLRYICTFNTPCLTWHRFLDTDCHALFLPVINSFTSERTEVPPPSPTSDRCASLCLHFDFVLYTTSASEHLVLRGLGKARLVMRACLCFRHFS